MQIDVDFDGNSQKNVNSHNGIEDGEINEILELDGIEVWGQHQTVLEQQALSHLKSLTEVSQNSTEPSNLEDGEIVEEPSTSTHSIINNKFNKVQSNALDINKYIERQAQLQQIQVKKKHIKSDISDKSIDIAKKISDSHFSKSNCKNNSDYLNFKKQKKLRKDSEISSHSEDNVLVQNEEKNPDSDSEYYPSDGYASDDSEYKASISTEKHGTKRKRKSSEKSKETDEKIKDDGLLTLYNARIKEFNLLQNQDESIYDDFQVEDNLKIPENIWNKLYSYQQDGVKWLWNIHKQTVGGLLGDEMGLGKTVQVIVFLAALEYSKIKCKRYLGLGPSIIVCPATVIHQWIKHFHDWWPQFRVTLLHQSGSYHGNKIDLINEINETNGILITTYESILKYKGVLAEKKWHYIILDEGHKIRNPNAKITVAVKSFRTPHKIILTGSPMQNNLQELWSLFDFVVPGKLGSQQAFTDYFATPITQGGFANATPTQETTALLIATSLKDMISPYMLRRTKDEVRDCIYLPNKSEQVLFCSLTDEQKDLYRGYLLSDQIGCILGRTSSRRWSDNQTRVNILVGITTLRKICNHPDLYLGESDENNETSPDEIVSPEKSFGYYKRSGKMTVVSALLKIWKRQGHRVLLFTQSRAMIDLFEDFLTQQEYKYLKMDGTTSVSNRQPLINTFNKDSSYNVFLLTTRVGGLGVNLIGADRVIIYDPDWNPATDTQARERAWRIGQKRQVTIYRLVSAGTIEEKMYQRQVWKQLLSNKILIDPKTKRFFKNSDLTDLFSFQEHTDTNPETANIFRNSKIEVNVNKKRDKSELETAITFSEDKIQAMKSLATQIAKKMSQNKPVENKKVESKLEQESEKRLTPAELLANNRKKLEKVEESIVNKIDDQETSSSFAKALTVVAKTTNKYRKKKDKPDEEPITTEAIKTKSVRKENGEKIKIDQSGQIDGERVQGLLKREVKKKDKNYKAFDKTQDDYVLEKLFSKKGVHTALQHDIIVQSNRKDGSNLKIHYEAQKKADMAIQALRKSRLNNWRW